MRPHIVALAAVLAFIPLHARAEQADCGAPATLEDGWTIAKPDEMGLDGARLCAIAERLRATNANVHGVVIVRGGKLVFEQYFAGFDEPWGRDAGRYEFDATTLHDMRSVTKSVISLLLGIALDRKLIASLDEPVTKYFPEYSDVKSAGWDRITLRHLLKMSSGLQWDENLPWNDKNDEWHLVYDADPLRYVFQKPFVFEPGTFFTYNGGGTDLLGKVIEKALGTRIDSFANEVLFKPLGITEWQLKDYRNGKTAMASGLRLRPRDAAKIGQLVLAKGEWQGRRIVSAEWIAESIKPRLQATNMFGGLFYYGHQWWIGRTLVNDREVRWVAGVGLGGQRLIIVPEHDLVVMVTQGLYSNGRQGQATHDLLANFILPAVRVENAR
ncbi:serine hydrolase domain-containing protein [Bradyrhizobium sp. HKCCYLS20291]|uniref:serine hydrolase domain-containing protein n=1 Tax=Bradyrhizobium sp. HKCCYLS20291 TaxID=3420766 RepID=UPI003EBF459D